jgi:ATP phosphoribosyltransferase
MSDVNLKYEKLGGVLREHQESLQTILSRMEEVQKEASSVLQWLESKEEVLKTMDASLSPTKTETVKAQAESNKVRCLHKLCPNTERKGFLYKCPGIQPRDNSPG